MPGRSAAGVTLVEGLAERDLGFLSGREEQHEPPNLSRACGIPTRRKVTWIVRGEVGEVTITLNSQRGGRHTLTLALGQ